MFKYSGNSEMIRACETFNNLSKEVRERVWVARVLSDDEGPVLIVCGAKHTDSLSVLFKRIGIQRTVICRDFEP